MQTRDWQRNREMWVRVLEKKTGKGVAEWNRRIRREKFRDEAALRTWLNREGVTGYAQSLLVMERFGYPDFLRSSAEQLIEAQYTDRPALRPVFDAVVKAAEGLGPVVVQARKTYVSLVSPRRTFARVQATTRDRVDLGLRLEGVKPLGRLKPSRIHETMQVQVGLSAPGDVNRDVVTWLRRAYAENR